MAQQSNSLSETLDSSLSISADPPPPTADHNQQLASSSTSSSISTDPSLSRSGSSSRLNAKAPEFVPRTSSSSIPALSRPDLTQPRAVIPSTLLSPPGLVHVYPPPTSSFRGPVQGYDVAVPNHFPVQNHRPHALHVPMQYHHHPLHHHRPQFYSGGGFVDHREGSVQSQQQQQILVEPDSSSNDKNSFSEETIQKIVNQVDYYFGDLNLATTEHLMRFINKDPEGYVPISVVASFKKIKALVNSNSQLADILRNSTKLLVSEDGKKVKRQQPLTEADMEELQSRIVVAENLPEDHCHQNLMKIFSTVGSVKNIRTCQPQASNSGASPASRSAKADTLYSNKLHAFVEYESIEHAEKAVIDLTEAKWRNGLRVRLMFRNTTKHVQTRVKKVGNETDPICDENDTSTSEQIQPNGKDVVVDDPSQHSDSRSQEITQGEEISNEKDGQRKGRNRNKGKGGRGRGQHHHQNNRGNQQQASPFSNNNEQPPSAAAASAIGKQPPPPGPRMPDGTRGFSMGRGKPVALNNMA